MLRTEVENGLLLTVSSLHWYKVSAIIVHIPQVKEGSWLNLMRPSYTMEWTGKTTVWVILQRTVYLVVLNVTTPKGEEPTKNLFNG